MTWNRLAAVALLGAATLLAACEDVVDPDGTAATYDLVEGNGDAVPAVVFEGETEFGHMVATAVSGSMTLRESTYTERVVFEIELDGSSLGEEPLVVSGSYSADGSLLTFDPDRTDYPTFTGTLQGGVLTTVEQDPDFGTLTLVWER